MKKCVPFSDYRKMETLMPNQPSKKIFNAAWKNTEEGKRFERNKKFVVSVVISVVVGKFVTNAFMLVPLAGVNEIVALKDSDPQFLLKMKDSFQMYEDTISILDIGHDKDLFLNIIRGFFNDFELIKLVQVCKGAKIDEIMNLLPTLFIK